MTNEEEIHLYYKLVPGKSRPISGVGEKKVSILSKSLFYHSSGNILGQDCHLFLYGLWANNDLYMFKWLKKCFLKIISWHVKIIGNKNFSVNSKVLEHSHSFFIYCLWVGSCYNHRAEWLQQSMAQVRTFQDFLYSGKESICQCWRCWSRGFKSCVGKVPCIGNGNPLQFSCWKNQWTKELGGL